MPLDPRTPVLVGAGVASQRCEDPREALEPVALMLRALRAAGDDAGAPDLLFRADSIRVPRGFWEYADPARLIADSLGADRARTVLGEIGILQTSLFGHAARDIASGECDVVLISGGETKYRTLRSNITGHPVESTTQPEGTEPDLTLRPEAELASELEIAHGLHMPVGQYGAIENALRHVDGMSIDEHRREVARMWADFSRVASENPHAWNRRAYTAEEIGEPSEQNPMLTFPYNKLHNSQWNVDQAAGLILCSADAARQAGVPENRWIFPHAVTESNFLLSLSRRRDLHRSIGFEIAGRSALGHAGWEAAEVDHFEFYSCFPAAVRVQAREIGVSTARPLTLCGGMSFAGGPLNNFVLQAAERMVATLRKEPGSRAMLNAVSGYISKQGVSLWSTRPPERFVFEDLSKAVEASTGTVEVQDEYAGTARVASYTVQCLSGLPARGIALCNTGPGTRTIASTVDQALMAEMIGSEFCGREVRIERDPETGLNGISG